MRVFVRDRRMEQHLTQRQLAAKLQTKDGKPLRPSYLCEIEKGQEVPSLDLALQIATVLNCKIEDLFSRE